MHVKGKDIPPSYDFYDHDLSWHASNLRYVKWNIFSDIWIYSCFTMVLMMLDQGVIRPCNSAFSFNPVAVKKPGQVNKFRFTINYKPLNDKIVADRFPQPSVSEILDSIAHSKPKFLTSIDLPSAFHQVSLAEESWSLLLQHIWDSIVICAYPWAWR